MNHKSHKELDFDSAAANNNFDKSRLIININMSEPTKEEKGGDDSSGGAGGASVLDILANAADAKQKVDDAVEDKVEDASASKDDKGKEDEVKKDDDTTKQSAPSDATATAPGPTAATHGQPPYEQPPAIPAMQQQAATNMMYNPTAAAQYGNMPNNPQAYNPAMMMNNFPQTKAPSARKVLPQTGVRNDVPMPFPEKVRILCFVLWYVL